MPVRKLILQSFQSPGDVTVMSATVRDLHIAHPGKFETDVRTSADALWLHNPYITRLSEGQSGVEFIQMHYPLIHECNQRPYHFLHGYSQYLEQQLGIKIPLTRFSGDIHLSAEEKNSPPPGAELGVPEHFWLVVAGGKFDFTAKWWNPESFQKVIDHFQGKIQFVQCGEAGHWHPPLKGVINLVGKTDTRSFIRLVYHADGVVCPVTFAMHLAAAVETKPGRPKHRPCVVIAGGREPPHWEAYPHHQFLNTVGALPCCADGGCWKSRCQLVGDGDQKDRHDVCVDPVQIRSDLRIARCMDLITPEHVIDRIELYYRGGALKFSANGTLSREVQSIATTNGVSESEIQNPESEITMNVLITFRHGLGDGVQLEIVLKHLQKYRTTWNVDVAALVGKHTAIRGLCRNVYILERESPPCCEYQQRFNLDWHECHTSYADSPSTKAERCLREEFGITPDQELCSYSIQVGAEALALARRYLDQVCKAGPGDDGRFPAVLIHFEGNTSAEMKNIPTEIIRRLCDDIIEDGFVPVILDWDYRNTLADGVRIHCPDQRSELWHGTGTGDAESLAAMTELSSVMIGVDSGPLHVAGATSTPTLGVWTRHHPLHYFSHADNVTHLVPRNHADLLRGDRETGKAYFNGHYQFQIYDDLEVGLRTAVRSRLHAAVSGLVYTRGYWVRADMAEQDLVVVQDIAEQDSYQIAAMPMPRPVVVDVGAHIGCFSKRLHERNPIARIFAVECCPENIPVLQKNIGDIATIIQAAVTYEPDVALLNAVYKNCLSTGGSAVISRQELERRVLDESRRAVGTNSLQVGARPRVGSCDESAPFQTDDEADPIRIGEYWADFRSIRVLTLEDLMREQGFDHIDILKLDCEGSEFSILGKTSSLDRIGLIVGEYHDKEKFQRLVVERFAGWDLQILHDGDLGTFWLTNPAFNSSSPLPSPLSRQAQPSAVNPVDEITSNRVHSFAGNGHAKANSEFPPPQTTGPKSQIAAPPVPTPDEFSQRLATVFHPNDSSQFVAWLPYYRKLFELACELRPSRICEIGVRAGYSAFAFLSANPDAHYHGIESDHDEKVANTHGGFRGAWKHAQQILAPFDVQIQLVSSQMLDELPGNDLAYVDGDHTFRGCLADLHLAAKTSDRVLVDDVDSIPAVRQACDTFTSEHPEFRRRYIDNDLTGWLLFERRHSPEPGV